MLKFNLIKFCRFIENKSSPNKELKKPWRMKILEELQLRISQDQIIKFKAYEKAIDMYVSLYCKIYFLLYS